MKRLGWTVTVCASVILMAAGCGKKVQPQAATVPPSASTVAPEPPPPPPPAPAPARELTEDEVFARKTLDELNRERPLADVFFAYDSTELDDRARATLQRNATWLTRWGSTRVVIEGHCDERGTPEYNLALGDRRAAMVREYLMALGVPADRVAVVSKGKEQPVCVDPFESCWQQNRRGGFLITAK